jgi:solute carrier family 35 (UDP-sugar transporter), member A1/2/3
LFLITFGVALVQLPPNFSIIPGNGSFSKLFHWGATPLPEPVTSPFPNAGLGAEIKMDRTLGLICVFAACTLSGLAGVYFEKVLKRSDKSIYVRNLQLSFFSLFPALFFGVLWKDGSQIREKVRSNSSKLNCIGLSLWI